MPSVPQSLVDIAANEDEWPMIKGGQGIVLYQLDAGTATGGTGASLAVTPALVKASQNPIVRTYLAAASPATW